LKQKNLFIERLLNFNNSCKFNEILLLLPESLLDWDGISIVSVEGNGSFGPPNDPVILLIDSVQSAADHDLCFWTNSDYHVKLEIL
jgi:hypothetical protein